MYFLNSLDDGRFQLGTAGKEQYADPTGPTVYWHTLENVGDRMIQYGRRKQSYGPWGVKYKFEGRGSQLFGKRLPCIAVCRYERSAFCKANLDNLCHPGVLHDTLKRNTY